MAVYLALVFTNPIEGCEEEYNKFYNEVAIPVYRSIPNMTVLGRFKSVPCKNYDFQMDLNWDYVSVYQFEAEDPKDFFSESKKFLAEAVERGEYKFNEFIDKETYFEPIYVKLEV